MLKYKFNERIYRIIRSVLFTQDAELVHKTFVKIGLLLGSNSITRKVTSALYNYQNPILKQKILGIEFKNPIGLAAGFDKNAELINLIDSVGFGFAEVGSVTAKPSKGNSGKRLSRIIGKKSIWVNLGLNNKGAEKIKKRIESSKVKIPLGISIARTNSRETATPEAGLKDFIESVKILKNCGDYLTINISCPNSYGGQPFSEPKLFNKLMKEIQKEKIKKLVFIKLSPDLQKEQLDKIIEISLKSNVSGFICSNLTKDKRKNSGGYSGKILEEKSNKLLEYVYKRLRNEKKKFVLIGVGGVSTAEDAYKKIKSGANLIQLITGMIYEGPGIISKINYDLTKLLEKDNYKNIGEAVGANLN